MLSQCPQYARASVNGEDVEAAVPEPAGSSQLQPEPQGRSRVAVEGMLTSGGQEGVSQEVLF